MSDAVFSDFAGRDDFDPLDAVMGEDWGVLKIPAKLGGAMQKFALDQQSQMARSRSSPGGGSSRLTTAFAGRDRQAMVKLIRNGGTSDARGLRDQMDYLRKEGSVELERSERYFGVAVDEEVEAEMKSFWGLSDDGEGKADRTSHFVVSFPTDTEHDAAYRAGRDWAEAMFASGDYGDHFDYYTAFHTDREHPHMHVVVNRRGLQEGNWLKVSQRGMFDYDEMRFVQVRVAAKHGIELEATPRVVRGITERPFTDCEVQRAQRQGREPQRRAHNAVSRSQMMLQRSIFARQVKADIAQIGGNNPDIAKAMNKALKHIQSGLELKALGPRNSMVPWAKIRFREIQKLNKELEGHRNEILQNFRDVDKVLDGIPEGPERTQLEKSQDAIKAEAAKFMPDIVSLREHGKPAPDKAYRGVEAYDEYTAELVASGHERIRGLSEEVGLAGDVMVARYGGKDGVSKAVADEWQAKERKAIAHRIEDGGSSPEEARTLASEQVAAFHAAARKVFDSIELKLEAYTDRRSRLVESLTYRSSPVQLECDINDRFAQTMKDTLTSDQRRKLEAGDISALSGISKSRDQQAQLAHRYLETEFIHAESARKGQLEQAIGKVERDQHEIDAQMRNDRTKNRGLNNSRDDGGFGL